ncbi:hypothetical protein LBMAG50_12370 [Phycisphaerae bacterium]|nr:hypothetical protein LBMAG50_12370 [Phycisphaerae bacterium]
MTAILTLEMSFKRRLKGFICGKLNILICMKIRSRLEAQVVDSILTEAECRDPFKTQEAFVSPV